MGDKNTISSSSNTSIYDKRNPPSCSDEISRFLRQILVRSSPPEAYPSESCSAVRTHGDPHADPQCFGAYPPPDSLAKRGMISAGEFSEGASSGGSASAACFLPSEVFFSRNIQGNAAATATAATHVSSSSFGASGNDTDDYDCESEEGVGAVVDEPPAKLTPPRRSSKRSRAAEVHNLSEKRRRSRINEKMKALQNLIPNSNKTDKASMLDEAIEYLKQLQLQVQMLTMRNGLSLHPPMCLPGETLTQPMQLTHQIRPTAVNLVEADNLLRQNSQFASSVSGIPEIINLEPSNVRDLFGPFPVLNPPCNDRLSISHSDQTNMPGFEEGHTAFQGQASDLASEDRQT